MASPAIARPALGRVFSIANPVARTTVTCLLAQQQQQQPHKSFSTTPHLAERRTRRDNNKKRGLSSMYPGSKLRHRMQIQPSEMPLPARNYEPKVETDPDHGLWEFFYARKQRFLEPDEMEAHGRAWHVEELRHKSWEDLHALWWTCVKERNRLVTMATEYETAGFTVGQNSMDERDVEIKKTMKHIKQALTERFYNWEDARTLAATDPEIDLNSPTNPYVPQDYMEPESEPVTFDETAAAVEESQGEGKGVQPSTIPVQAAGDAKQETRV